MLPNMTIAQPLDPTNLVLSAQIRAIAGALTGYTYTWSDEYQFQEGIEGALKAAGHDVRREVQVGTGRIDLMVGRVGIEVKVNGAPNAVERQLLRYTESDDIDAVLLVTSKMSHANLSGKGNDKPIAVLVVTGGAL